MNVALNCYPSEGLETLLITPAPLLPSLGEGAGG
jgi:hypothetical protein